MKNKFVNYFIIGIIILLYLITSLISTLHVIDFFGLSNPNWLAILLAAAFEVGAAASLASILMLKKVNKLMIWLLFIVLTIIQINGNVYYAYVNAHDFQGWIELFGLADAELIQQKRILSIVSGAILPIIALGFIKSLVDYIKPETQTDTNVMKPMEAPVLNPIVDQTMVNEQRETIEETSDVSIEEVKPVAKPTTVLINTPIVEPNVPIITKNAPINTQLNLFDDTNVNEPVIPEEVKTAEIQSIDQDINPIISNNIQHKETVIDKLFKKIKIFK